MQDIIKSGFVLQGFKVVHTLYHISWNVGMYNFLVRSLVFMSTIMCNAWSCELCLFCGQRKVWDGPTRLVSQATGVFHSSLFCQHGDL